MRKEERKKKSTRESRAVYFAHNRKTRDAVRAVLARDKYNEPVAKKGRKGSLTL